MILFITRKYPPSIGGMQQLSHNLIEAVGRQAPTRVIKWGGSQRWLPVFMVHALVRALWILATKQVGIIHIGDPVLSPLGVLLRAIGDQPVVVNAHGLDVAYPSRLYQTIIPACMRQLDFVICISEHTRQLCLARRIQPECTKVIPVGVNVDDFSFLLSEVERHHWTRVWGLRSPSERVLLTVGRLVPRKGITFLVSQVLPPLAEQLDNWVCLVVGDGPERDRIQAAVRHKGLEAKVRLLGQVSDEELRAAYAMASLFLMPNIPVYGDSEGFGLVTLEARAAGLPIVASSLEGIPDSFQAADDGMLVPPGDADSFVEAIHSVLEPGLTLEDRLRRREQIRARYGWSHIAEEYLAVFRDAEARYSQAENRGSKHR